MSTGQQPQAQRTGYKPARGGFKGEIFKPFSLIPPTYSYIDAHMKGAVAHQQLALLTVHGKASSEPPFTTQSECRCACAPVISSSVHIFYGSRMSSVWR